MRTAVTRFLGVAALALVASSGCGVGGGSAPVEGKVTLNGQALSGATVMFSQTRATAPGPFVGETDAQGQYTLTTPDKSKNGAVPGEYTIIITTVKQAAGGMEDTPVPTQKEVVPTAFRDGSTRYTVPEGGAKDANFDMKGK
jgi:hypothetical protein